MHNVYDYLRDMFSSGLEIPIQTLKSGALENYRGKVEGAVEDMVERGEVARIKRGRYQTADTDKWRR